MSFQVLVLNHLDLSAYVVPQVFILLLISLPLSWSKVTLVAVAFGLGLLADFFVGTPGIHASGCMWLVLLRIRILNTQDLNQQIANKLNYDVNTVGIAPFVYTTLILVFFYHIYIFWLQNIGALIWINYVLTVVISSLLSITIIAIVQYLSFQRR